MASRASPSPADPLAGASALVARLALVILLIGAPIASAATRQAVYAIVPIGAALTLVAWLMEPDTRGFRRLRTALATPAGLGGLFLAAWAALSLLWTPFAVGPTERFAKTAATIGLVGIAIALMPPRTKTSNLYLLPIGAMAGAIAVIVAIVLRWSPPTPPGELTVLDRAALGLSLLFWPGVAGLLVREKHALAILLSGVTLCAVVTVGTPVGVAAFVLSALTYLAARGRAPQVARGLAIGFGALILLAPLVALLVSEIAPPRSLPPAMDTVVIWGQIVAKDGFRVLIGHGFDAAARAVAAGYLPPSSVRSMQFELWFELGVVGVGAAIFVIARIFVVAGAAPTSVAPLLLAGLMSALVISAFNVGIAPIWWITLLALDALAFALVFRGQFRGRRPSVRDIEGLRPPALARPRLKS